MSCGPDSLYAIEGDMMTKKDRVKRVKNRELHIRLIEEQYRKTHRGLSTEGDEVSESNGSEA